MTPPPSWSSPEPTAPSPCTQRTSPAPMEEIAEEVPEEKIPAARSPFSEPARRGRSASRSHRREKKDKKEKKEKTSSGHRHRRRQRSPEGHPDKSPLVSTTQPAESKDKRGERPRSPSRSPRKVTPSKSKTATDSRQKCRFCWKKITGHEAGRAQHEWTNLYCLQYQLFGQMKDTEQTKEGWKKAGEIAKELRAKRMNDQVPAPRASAVRGEALEASGAWDKKTSFRETRGGTAASSTSKSAKKPSKEKKKAPKTPDPSSEPEKSSSESPKPTKKKKKAGGSDGSKRTITINITG